jgi:predicted transposase YbfD/YdcC
LPAEVITRKQAHYLFVVKANQPTLLARCAGLPWQRVPIGDRTRDRGHVELRTLKAVSVNHFGFPHAAQVIQVTRKTRDLATRRWHTVVVYAITILQFEQTRPARLADLLRGHWTIENGLHWVRDVTFAEDASQLRTGAAPQVMACLRNLVIGVLCRAGPVNLAAALRHHSRDPQLTTRHPRDHPRMKRTQRENAGALPLRNGEYAQQCDESPGRNPCAARLEVTRRLACSGPIAVGLAAYRVGM